RRLDAPPVLGIVLDGLGWGEDGTIWGGEFLLADYRQAERLGTFKPVAMLGGDKASREPWRNLYAHLMAEMGWAEFALNFSALELYRYLEAKPRALLDAMLRQGINAPKASSCGRLFDAMAAAVGICRERQAYEGEAPQRLEALADARALAEEDDTLAYPMSIPRLPGSGLPYLEPLMLWRAVLGDLILGTAPGVMSARFHKGLARALVAMARKLGGFDTVALTGGCFQNRLLLGETQRRLEEAGFRVLRHARVPAHDGGLALGQAAVAAARLMEKP
ncbi:MAG TPA: carbamoyltransferase HypF, partial [Burkholderiales bacterium]|nr:carbamoyltransferase HypF [Burkholderiales bacterium]